jgi:hypothetical protein
VLDNQGLIPGRAGLFSLQCSGQAHPVSYPVATGIPPSEVKWLGHKDDHSLPLRLRMCGAIYPLPHTSTSREYGGTFEQNFYSNFLIGGVYNIDF